MVTATLVPPRTLPDCTKFTKIRLEAGSNGTLPDAKANTAKVGVWPAPILTFTLGVAFDRQAPVVGFVRQTSKVKGRPPLPGDSSSVGVTVIDPLAPRLDVATLKALAPDEPGIRSTPSPDVVAETATISGTGLLDAENSKVLTPGTMEASTLFAQSTLGAANDAGVGAFGVKENINVRLPFAGMFTATLGDPTG